MVPTKNTRSSRSDPIRSQYDTERYGFFSIECSHSQYFESGRAKQFKERKGERHNQNDHRRVYRILATSFLDNTPLFRGKELCMKTGYLKPEPEPYETTMFHETDCEFFQDLVQWCSDPAKEETAAIDSPIPKQKEKSDNTDTLHTTFSPQGWNVLDVNSPAQVASYTSTPNDPLSPNMEGYTNIDRNFLYNIESGKKTQLPEPLDILNMPVVLGELASEEMVDLNLCSTMEPSDYYINSTQNTEYTPALNTHKMFIHNVDEDDSLDMKLGAVIMGEVENHNIFNNDERREVETKMRPAPQLSLDVATPPAIWPSGVISTPEVLSYVEQLEKEECVFPFSRTTQKWPSHDTNEFVPIDSGSRTTATPSVDIPPLSPKSEAHLDSDFDDVTSHSSRKKRHNSEDSDETYTPYSELTPRKYKRRKPNLPIKEMIQALEESQQIPKARRGRPPKRRESNVSSACSIDDNTSCTSTLDDRYRSLRDKNNEASKRSRMNRKLKELQMEQLALELEERNKKLKVKADILEDMTKRLKDALMTAIIQK